MNAVLSVWEMWREQCKLQHGFTRRWTWSWANLLVKRKTIQLLAITWEKSVFYIYTGCFILNGESRGTEFCTFQLNFLTIIKLSEEISKIGWNICIRFLWFLQSFFWSLYKEANILYLGPMQLWTTFCRGLHMISLNRFWAIIIEIVWSKSNWWLKSQKPLPSDNVNINN